MCRGGEGGLVGECSGEAALDAVHDAVAAAVAAGEPGAEGDALLCHYFASRALRRLVLASCAGEEGGDGEASCAAASRAVEALWERGGLAGGCARWVGTHADKVLAALVRCGSASAAAAARAELAPLVAPEGVEAWAERLAGPTAQHAKQHKGPKRKKGAGGGGAAAAAGAARPPAKQAAAGPAQQGAKAQPQKKKAKK